MTVEEIMLESVFIFQTYSKRNYVDGSTAQYALLFCEDQYLSVNIFKFPGLFNALRLGIVNKYCLQ